MENFVVPEKLGLQEKSSPMPKNEKRVFEVEIAGTSMKLRTSHDEATVRQLVEFVDKRIQEALQMTKSGSTQSATVLACLNMAEELILLKRKAHSEIERLEIKTRRVLMELESSQEAAGLNN